MKRTLPGHEVIVSLERAIERDDLVTAAEASCNPAFRELFSDETLSPDILISVSQMVVVLAAPVSDAGGNEPDAAAFARLSTLHQTVASSAQREGGGVIKLMGHGVMAMFTEPVAALRACAAILEETKSEPACLAVHGGPTIVTTINDRLDYFGGMLDYASVLLSAGEPGAVMVSEQLAGDPGVVTLLLGLDHSARLIPGSSEVALCVTLPAQQDHV